jgi:hypothetical protein
VDLERLERILDRAQAKRILEAEKRCPYRNRYERKSASIRRALAEAKAHELKAIALLGRDGGSARWVADIDLVVAGDSTARIQEGHKFILHVLCKICETVLPHHTTRESSRI